MLNSSFYMHRTLMAQNVSGCDMRKVAIKVSNAAPAKSCYSLILPQLHTKTNRSLIKKNTKKCVLRFVPCTRSQASNFKT